MYIREDSISQLKKLLDLFPDLPGLILHIQSDEEFLSYYFIGLNNIDLQKKQACLDGKSFLEAMTDILKETFDNDRLELKYKKSVSKLTEYEPNGMQILEKVLLNPYRRSEPDNEKSCYAYKDYVKNCFYDWLNSVDWKKREDIITTDDSSFTPKESLQTLLEVNGFSKKMIPGVHVVRCIQHPIERTIHYSGS